MLVQKMTCVKAFCLSDSPADSDIPPQLMKQRSRVSSQLVEDQNALRGQLGPSVLSKPASQNSDALSVHRPGSVSRFSQRPGQEASAEPLRKFSGNKRF